MAKNTKHEKERGATHLSSESERVEALIQAISGPEKNNSGHPLAFSTRTRSILPRDGEEASDICIDRKNSSI